MVVFLNFFSSTYLFPQGYDDNLYQNFQDPPADARPMVRWWWFGAAVVKPELEKELHTMKDAGFRGTIRFRSSRSVTESWNPDTAVANTIAQSADGMIPLTLAPYESRVLVLKQSPDVGLVDSPNYKERQAVYLSTGWQIRFGDSPQPLARLVSWTELAGRRFYSGEAIYTRTFTLGANPGHTVVDFGEGTPTVDTRPPTTSGIHALLDPPIRESAIVYVNGTRAGSLWHPPYRLDITAFAHPGENTLEIRAYNTAINELAGQPAHDYTALNTKYGKRFEPQDMDNLKPIPSGLIGTIRLITETEDSK